MKAAKHSAARGSGAGGRKRRQRGVAIVEQAFILPVMLALMFGVIDMSRALYTYHYVSYIARDATRWASVRSNTSINGSSVGQVQNYVSNVNGMGLDSSQVTSTTSYVAPSNLTPLCPAGATSSNVNNKPGCIVRVTVDYNFKFIVPLIPGGGFTMSSESQTVITQ
jgi:Flp pilus assembly protein TadG